MQKLTCRQVGEYGGISWRNRTTPIVDGSREDRTRDIHMSVASVRLTDTMNEAFFASWRAVCGVPGTTLILRLHFWDGPDRYRGPMRDIEVYWSRLDRFLAEMPLPLIYAITLSEESVPYLGRREMLEALYHRVKAKYAVQVYQWYSPPSVLHSDRAAYPHTAGEFDKIGNLAADGWVCNPYWLPLEKIRRYVQRMVLTGQPVILMPWASDDELGNGETCMTPARRLTIEQQLDVAVEFDLPVAWYWTKTNSSGGSSVYFGCNRGSTETLIDQVNQMVWDHSERVKSLPASYLGLPSADLSVGAPFVQLPKLGASQFQFREQFDQADIVGQATFTGFRNFASDGTKLDVVGFNGRSVDSTLTWLCKTLSPVKTVLVQLNVTPPPDAEPDVELTLELVGTGKLIKFNPNQQASGALLVTLNVPASQFSVQVQVRGAAGRSRECPLVTLNSLSVTATK